MGNGGPTGIALDGEGHLYFSRASASGDEGELVEQDLTSGSSRVLAQTFALGIAIDGDDLFGTECDGAGAAGGVYHVSRSTGRLQTITQDALCPFSIALGDDANVYYFDYADRTDTTKGFAIWRVPRAGGAESLVAPSDGLEFVVDGTSLYVFQGGALVREPLDGGAPTTIAPALSAGSAPRLGLAVDGEHVFWTETDATQATVLRSVAK